MRSLRCLIVEDDEAWQRSFIAALAKSGFTAPDIRIVADKAQALVELEAWDPDLVLLDLGIDAAKGRGDVHQRHGRQVLAHVGQQNRQRIFHIMVLVISGHIDEYEQQALQNDPCVVRAVNKADVSDALPKFIKRAQKCCLPVYRDLKNHWPSMYAKFEAIMNDSSSSADVLSNAYDIAKGSLENLGQTVMGANYPCTPSEDIMFRSIEVLRGNDSKIAGTTVAPECWIAGIVYEHFHTIRRYCNAYRHFKLLRPRADYRMPLDPKQDADIIASLENFDRVANLVRVAVTDILEWYLPWHVRNLSTAAPRPSNQAQAPMAAANQSQRQTP